MGHILVVDDEPELVRFVARALEADGHQVAVAADGAEGLRLALTQQPDLTVLDLLMPGVDGRAMLSGLLAAQEQARVLVLSAAADVEARVWALETGAVDFVSKPFALRELLARVRMHTRDRTAPPASDEVRMGDIVLDLQTRTLRVDDYRVSLSPREFLLLLHLTRHQGTVCSRQELLSEVWGYAFDPATNVVDVYIARLRHKLHRDLIRTVRNVGYQLQVS